ncbi:GDSL-type esterase/lipase family protein [Pedobacter arcticus]|uniref:GDSL-type esterase/lipase family protein n=1 Tax=Pedobacter arcticus TaxID=752140 RepID=UPI00030828F7|nr:GDSL-type esterase/lipase family protein [Pedobacter arcticus]
MKFFFRLNIWLIFLIGGNAYAQKIKIACIGNSVTAGYLLKNPEKESYPAQLQQLLGDKYLVSNFGHSGATLLKKGHNPFYKTREFINALDFHADIAIVHLGLNDTDPRNWPNYKNDFEADYAWLIDTLRQDNPEIKIYICKLTPIFSGHPRFKSGTRDWYQQIQDKIPLIAKANEAQLIDLNAPLNHHPNLFADNLHPDVVGTGIIAKTVYEHITGDFGGFTLDPIFTNNMVLQRDQPIAIYGTANANDKVEISFNQIKKEVITNQFGKWKVQLPAMKFGGPYQLKISTQYQSITLKNILIGDVWLCSGQSNMAFPLKSSATAKATLSHLNKNLPIRLLKFNTLAETDHTSWDSVTLAKINQLDYFSGRWDTLSENSGAQFSAIAYYFGEKLNKEVHIPIGLIQMAVGGSTLESWIDRETMEQDNLMVDMLDNWRKSDFIQPWVRERAAMNLKNATNPKQRHPYEPTYNFEAGISKLTSFPIKGAIWYQGESNAHNPELFSHEFPLMVKSWRKKWGFDFPFYYVQLSSIDRPSWSFFRDVQGKLQSLIPNSGMAVSSDLGDSLNVHPTQKKQVGERLALLALKNTYHKNIVATGPIPLKATQNKSTIIITFSNTVALSFGDNPQLLGFEIVTNKGNRLAVKATIFKNEVHLNIPQNLKVVKILYAWQPFTKANLVNEAKLPASTFCMPLNQSNEI